MSFSHPPLARTSPRRWLRSNHDLEMAHRCSHEPPPRLNRSTRDGKEGDRQLPGHEVTSGVDQLSSGLMNALANLSERLGRTSPAGSFESIRTRGSLQSLGRAIRDPLRESGLRQA